MEIRPHRRGRRPPRQIAVAVSDRWEGGHIRTDITSFVGKLLEENDVNRFVTVFAHSRRP